MPAPFRISIVTPTLDAAACLADTVASVLEQRGPFQLEYLVEDGGSTDGTLEILRQHGLSLRFHSEPDTGPASAVNRGLLRATGDVVGWLNAGDVLYPEALARVATLFRFRGDVAWVHGRCDLVDEHRRPTRRWVSASADWNSRRYDQRRLAAQNFIMQPSVFWRRELSDRVGLLDETMRYGFDYEFWLRLSAVAAPTYIPERMGALRWRADDHRAEAPRRAEEEYASVLRHAPDVAPRHRRSGPIVRVLDALSAIGA